MMMAIDLSFFDFENPDFIRVFLCLLLSKRDYFLST